MCEALPFAEVRRVLEVPLDGIVGERLAKASDDLPAWRAVKHLSPEVSDQYQAAARSVAEGIGVDRVDLDAVWWGLRESSVAV
jgi:hypothetical protein